MNEKILYYFNQELKQLYKHGKSFAKAYPEYSQYLDIEHNDDPLIKQLIESFAFLTARLQHNIDHQQADMTKIIMQRLYPNYVLPYPSSAIIAIKPKTALDKPFQINKNTALQIENSGDNYQYSTCYPVTINPFDIKSINYDKKLDNLPDGFNAKSRLNITIKTNKPNVKIDQLAINSLQFYLNQSTQYDRSLLYEQLFDQLSGIAVTCEKLNNHMVFMPINCLDQGGFATQESILPDSENVLAAHQIVSEYFSYPEKFNFFTINHLKNYINPAFDDQFSIIFYFSSYEHELADVVNNNSLLLHCTPIVNITKQAADPIRITHQHNEYQVIIDKFHHDTTTMIYDIDSVNINAERYGSEITCEPFYGKTYQSMNKALYWASRRKACWQLGDFDTEGDEQFISFTEHGFISSPDNPIIVTPIVYTMNRKIDQSIVNAGQIETKFVNLNNTDIDNIHLVSSITQPVYAEEGKNLHQLISSIINDQFVFANNNTILNTIKNLIDYFCQQTMTKNKLITAITAVNLEQVIARHPLHSKFGFCQGYLITILINESGFVNRSIYLFGTVLARFFSALASTNSFIQLAIETEQQKRKYLWKP